MQRQLLGANNEILIETDFDIERALVFLPGMNGVAHSSRFQPLVALAEDAGYAIARLNLWEDAEAAAELSLATILERLESALDELLDRDIDDIVIVGKSFGGGVALMCENHTISKKILWAPAFTCVEGEGSVEAKMTVKLGEIEHVTDLTVSAAWIAQQSTPIGIVHGTHDDVISVGNSEAIATAAKTGELKMVAGADHSFKTPEHERALYAATKDLLQWRA